MKKIIKRFLRWLAFQGGLEVRRISSMNSGMELKLRSVPGMISPDQALAYFLISFSQSLAGDIVEVGCWQGRSTIALAQGCKDSRNGRVHAIDHFLGNPGKREFYVQKNEDLSDLRGNFEKNIDHAGLSDVVCLHPIPADEVKISGPIRMLVIDGEHTLEAVTADFRRFRDAIVPGGIVVFDDYSPDFPEVIEAVGRIYENETGSQLIHHNRMALLRLPL